EIHATALVSEDASGARQPRLAAVMPSFDNGGVVLLPDGRMQVTWHLRPGVTWQDGSPFTSDDLAFSFDVLRNPDVSSSGSQITVIRRMDSVEAPDPLTFVMTWKTPFYQALDMGIRNFWPFPKHLLADAYQGDVQAFIAQ